MKLSYGKRFEFFGFDYSLCKFTTDSLVSQHKSSPSMHTGQLVHAVYLWSISVSEQVILGHCSCLVTRLQTREAEEDPIRSRQLVLFPLTPSPLCRPVFRIRLL